jgi:hypothetical protein
MAAAVFLPVGSSNKRGCVAEEPRNASAVRNRKDSFVITVNGATEGICLIRSTVLSNRVCPSTNGMNGLGNALREAGHKRVPAPPLNMNG